MFLRLRILNNLTGKAKTSLSCFHRPFTNFPSPSASPSLSRPSETTLHEESAAGLNGRFARLAVTSSPADLLAFHARLPPSDLHHLNLASFNYILEAMLADGRQMDAFRFIARLEERNVAGFPDRESFTILMRGLVEADSSGSLALTVDELFELMQKKYSITPDLTTWALRIRAFLHPKFTNTLNEPAKIFYNEMSSTLKLSTATHDNFNVQSALNSLNAELIITAVNRRLWSFSEWILSSNSNHHPDFLFIDKIASASGIFLDPSSIPVLRYLLFNSKNAKSDSIVLNSIGFNLQLLMFCWRQGKSAADLALPVLKWLIKHLPHRSEWWIETAEGCLRREMPRDFYTLDSDDARDRLAMTIERVKCTEQQIKELEQEIIHQKLFN